MNLRRFEPFQGTRVVVLEGEGVAGDPYREVSYYFDEGGALIVSQDRYPKEPLAPEVVRTWPDKALDDLQLWLGRWSHNPNMAKLRKAIEAERQRRRVSSQATT